MFLSKYLQLIAKTNSDSPPTAVIILFSLQYLAGPENAEVWITPWGKNPPKNIIGQWNGKNPPLEIQIFVILETSLTIPDEIPRTLEVFLWLVLNVTQMQELACFVEMICTLSPQRNYRRYQCRNSKTNTTEFCTAEIRILVLSVTIQTKPRTGTWQMQHVLLKASRSYMTIRAQKGKVS